MAEPLASSGDRSDEPDIITCPYCLAENNPVALRAVQYNMCSQCHRKIGQLVYGEVYITPRPLYQTMVVLISTVVVVVLVSLIAILVNIR